LQGLPDDFSSKHLAVSGVTCLKYSHIGLEEGRPVWLCDDLPGLSACGLSFSDLPDLSSSSDKSIAAAALAIATLPKREIRSCACEIVDICEDH
jgi:hypothetical protein